MATSASETRAPTRMYSSLAMARGSGQLCGWPAVHAFDRSLFWRSLGLTLLSCGLALVVVFGFTDERFKGKTTELKLNATE